MSKSKIKEKPFRLEDGEGGIKQLILSASPTLVNADIIDKSLDLKKLFSDSPKGIVLDLSETADKDFDSYLVILINRIRKASEKRKIPFSIIGLPDNRQGFVNLFSRGIKGEVAQADGESNFMRYFENIGIKTKKIIKDGYSFLEFLGNLIISLVKIPFKPTAVRWKDFPFHFNNAGVNAVPIVILIVFMIGVIMGYEGALLLKEFGADIYVADLIGISVCRELSPLLTAIIVAGRSGSSYAAELGTMKVSEEIDALQTMGMDLYQFLVLPRVIAVSLSIPLITALGDIAGIVGGYLAAITSLNITLTGYLNELSSALSYAHVFSGIGKSVLFGFLVAAVGCYRGMQASGGAESVGRYTTSAVVTGIMLIILSDTVLTFVFQVLGI